MRQPPIDPAIIRIGMRAAEAIEEIENAAEYHLPKIKRVVRDGNYGTPSEVHLDPAYREACRAGQARRRAREQQA